ncbi:cytochrome oxidase assembly protein [Opitutaceae bacterium EW11]|nr:cytochrome oxidase assembly protein [Opitutaceae bacterium EW11]
MSVASPTARTSAYRPALAWFAVLGSLWVFVLVMLGAFTTSIGAGMAFPDWPLSNGSLNPHGWLTNVAMFAEHSHRLSGTTMGLVTIALAIWLWKTEARGWLRKLGGWALALVVVQGVIGGQRVRLDGWYPAGMTMSVGQMLRIPHGILAEIFVIVLFAIAAALSRRWTSSPVAEFASTPRIRRLGILCTGLVLVQLVIAATMRHLHAGLAIPTFPLTPEGGLIPAQWSFPVGIHFAHRAMALVLSIALPWFGIAVWRAPGSSNLLKNTAALMLGFLVLQVLLGASIIWTARDPYVTTAHVIVGAITLAVTFLLTWFAHRNAVEGKRAAEMVRKDVADEQTSPFHPNDARSPQQS